MTCLGVFEIEEIRDKDNETGLKRGRRNRNVNLQCFHIRDARSLFALYLLTVVVFIDGVVGQMHVAIVVVVGRGVVRCRSKTCQSIFVHVDAQWVEGRHSDINS